MQFDGDTSIYHDIRYINTTCLAMWTYTLGVINCSIVCSFERICLCWETQSTTLLKSTCKITAWSCIGINWLAWIWHHLAWSGSLFMVGCYFKIIGRFCHFHDTESCMNLANSYMLLFARCYLTINFLIYLL